MLELVGALAGIGALLYMAFIGQKSLKEWRWERGQALLQDAISDEPPPKLHNLPNPDYVEFVGREAEVKEIVDLLRPYPHSQHAVITIDGVGGVGKSALALEMAHRYLRNDQPEMHEPFDALIWTSAKESVLTAEGIHPRKYALRTLHDVFVSIATTLEREDILNADEGQRSDMIRKALTAQRTLLIIDNLETVDDEAVLEFLRDLPAPTKAVVTTRHRIDMACPIRLKGMPRDDAFRLMQREGKKKEVEVTDEQLTKLYDRTGGVPLAMVWCIARMGLGYTFDSVFKELGKCTGDVSRFSFKQAISSIREGDAYRLLMALGLFATSASRGALGKITELDENVRDRDEGLVVLERLSLVNKQADRFSLLPMTRSYVLGTLARNESLERKLGRRWLDYLRTLCGDPEQAFFWRWSTYEFIEDGPNLLAAVEYAYENGTAEDVFHLAFGAMQYLEITGLWKESYELSTQALELARNSGDDRVAARFLGDMGWMSQQWGNYNQADREFEESRRIFKSLGDREGICKSMIWSSRIRRKRGDVAEAEQVCNEALEMADSLDLEHLKVDVRSEHGKLMRDMDRLDEAWESFNYVRDWGERVATGTPHNQQIAAGSWGQLASVAIMREEYELAQKLCQRSLDFFERKGSKGYLATLKYRMALANQGLRRKKNALSDARQALYWFKRLGMRPDVEAVEAVVAELGG